MPQSVSIAISDHIATVTLDRPPVNAIDLPTIIEIRDAFESLEDNIDVRAVIFTGGGTKAFCAGADLRSMGEPTDATGAIPPRYVTDRQRTVRDAFDAINHCPVPVIGAINGPALGGGLALAACCDILFAAEHATFGTTEINVGLLGASAHLTRLVGRYKAREMYFSGEVVPAAELHRLGAVRAVVAGDRLMEEARAFARVLVAKSPIAMRLAKEAMNRTEDLPLAEAYRTEQDYTARLSRFNDAKEASRAYREKRDPEWTWS
jgi:enoyl-CoA hydratase